MSRENVFGKWVRAVWATHFGGAEGARTPDPRLAKPVLSQLSYSPNDIRRMSACPAQDFCVRAERPRRYEVRATSVARSVVPRR